MVALTQWDFFLSEQKGPFVCESLVWVPSLICMQKWFAKGSALGHEKAKETVIFNAHHDTASGCFLLEDSIVDLSWKFSSRIASYLEGLCLQSLIDRMAT